MLSHPPQFFDIFFFNHELQKFAHTNISCQARALPPTSCEVQNLWEYLLRGPENQWSVAAILRAVDPNRDSCIALTGGVGLTGQLYGVWGKKTN
jgi:hypothetical protein